jgi:hypothetical protein
MKAFRITIATILGFCAVPIAALAAAWTITASCGCTLQWEAPHVCHLGAADISWLLDGLVRLGVWGALTAGLAAYVFAAWVMVELAALVLSGLRRR